MTTVGRVFDEQGQSLWLDNLARADLRDGTLARLVASGIRGVTANPTIVARAIEASDAYDEQFATLLSAGHPVADAYEELVIADVVWALEILRPTFDQSRGGDGFVSIEVAPRWAHDADATVVAARALHERIREPNLLVKIPATDEGVRAIEAMIGEGRSINVTLLFSLRRYGQVLDAYLSGLETLSRRGGDLSAVHSVASFFVSRVDTEVDRRLDGAGTPAALRLRGRSAVAQAKLAYQLFRKAHSCERWEGLARQGARVQRPLWASTSTKNPDYPDTLYVDNLIGPDTVNTLPEDTFEAFVDHGTVVRTIDTDVEEALAVMAALSMAGVDMDDVGHTLEVQGIDAFDASVAHVLGVLEAKPRTHPAQRALAASATGDGHLHHVPASVGESLIEGAARHRSPEAGVEEQAARGVRVQVVVEPSGGDVATNEGD
jgi:transaldolase